MTVLTNDSDHIERLKEIKDILVKQGELPNDASHNVIFTSRLFEGKQVSTGVYNDLKNI